MPRLLILTAILSSFLTSYSQKFNDAGVIFELIGGEHIDMAELFESRDAPFQIEQFLLNESKNTLEFSGGCTFSFLPNDVIQTCVYKKNPQYCRKEFWKWTENEEGDKFGYIEMCNTKGKLKWLNPDFKTIETSITSTDSIVEKTYWRVNTKGDTTCGSNYKWIFRSDTLIEYWRDGFPSNCSWESSKHFNITKYYYPDSSTTIKEEFTGSVDNMKSYGKRETVRMFDDTGRLIKIETRWNDNLNKRRQFERRFFYQNGSWIKTEEWFDDILVEVIIKKDPPTSRVSIIYKGL